MRDKIQFIFVGRLVKEKGFDLILQACKQLAQDSGLHEKLHIDIFGDGELRDSLEEYLGEWNFVTYHRHQSKTVVFETRKTCHYTLMPSKFLETFGLSALDSLSLGVPVIGPAKGGLAQFIQTGYQLSPTSSLYDVLISCIQNFDSEQRVANSREARALAKKYTHEVWLEKFQTLSGLAAGSKILLVSDYIVDVGGIESYLLTIKSVLEEAGYVVAMYGCKDKNIATNRFQHLGMSLWNTRAERGLQLHLQDKPDLVWRHSVHRWLGPTPLQYAGKGTALHRVMYHDFGLFHPFPSCVYEEQQLVHARSFVGYMQEGIRCKGIVYLPLLLVKYLLSIIIRKRLVRGEQHLVPSPYMKQYIAGVPADRVDTLAHFI